MDSDQDVSFGAIAASAPDRDGKKCINKVQGVSKKPAEIHLKYLYF